MPFQKGNQINKGKISPKRNGKYIPCSCCGKLVYFSKSRLNKRKYCSQKCMGKDRIGKSINLREKNGNWSGGIRKSNNGNYIEVLKPNHPLANKYGCVRQSRLIMEKHLGRYLKPKEVVHHKNGNTLDDRIKNLKLFSNNSKHLKFHHPNDSPFAKKSIYRT
jgi:hypothetical protein